MLLHEFLDPLEMSQSEFARHLHVPIQRINELIRAKRGITPNTAWLLSKALGTSPGFWMNMQVAYDLSSIDPSEGVKRLVA